ncbi:ornithine cyclodeaminase family protein [Bordetella petrii]|uniref:ornithine cyclodeaminase family protein n=1 Tax=Bordetella petrii TaxID=94624 RepID=UPI001E40E17E|nr:NAD(P)-binding domain-containing protein [Bordetella petrii]MCD0505459.1 NAD(P)-binding domain-containing protein [Bordetella petrii]
MLFISDEQVAQTITMRAAVDAMQALFQDLGRGAGVIQERVRVHDAGVSLSMMGGIHTGAGVMGAKVYPTINGQFNFIIPLFACDDGRLLCTVAGNALTRLRTAAVTRVAADRLKPGPGRKVAVFGSGVQADSHVEAFALDGYASEFRVVSRSGGAAFAEQLQQRYGVPVSAASAEEAVAWADVVITATRAAEPLFDGKLLQPGTLVAAIGSSKPVTREVDDEVLRRAALIAVESASQTAREGGELVMAGPDTGASGKIVELGALLQNQDAAPATGDLLVYKSVGIGLEDVALAHHIYRSVAA